MDILFLRNFRLDFIIGIYEWERKTPQPVRIDLEIGLADSKAATSDDVKDTIDYGQVATRITQMAASRAFDLVETVAEETARIVLQDFGAPWVRVSVAKFAIVRGIEELGIIIERRRH
jgi:7,8-dihydroneopterin aldolase/epimerase/oxygenase